jgi:spore coat protein CotH
VRGKALYLLLFLIAVAAGCGGGSHEGSSAEVPWEPPPDYSITYNQSTLDEYEIELSAANYQALQDSPFEYVSGTLRFKSETYYNAGIRYKGNSSYFAMPGVKKSFKMHFNEFVPDQRFHGLKKLNFNNCFNDPTLMREALAYRLMRDAGVPASRTSHVKLYITVPGTYNREFFGVYISVEQVNKAFLKDRFGNEGGNLFKAQGMNSDLSYLGADQTAYYAKYELKTNEIENNYFDLINLCNVITNTPGAQFKNAIEAVLNVDGFLSWLAVNTVLSYQDSYAGKAHNYYLYHNTETGRFEFIPWDLNTTFGQSRFGKSADYMLSLDVYEPTFGNYRILIDRLLNIPEYLSSYEDKLRDLLDLYFNAAQMDPRIDTMYDLIKTDVYADSVEYVKLENSVTDRTLNGDREQDEKSRVYPAVSCRFGGGLRWRQRER